MTPRISVLVPCYNHGRFIGDTLASVRAQTVQDFEVIVVDDGSTDAETIETLRGLQGAGVTVLTTENQGLPAARNHAARHASGAVFCALDADDLLAPAWFEKGLAVLDSRPEVAFVSHWLDTFGDEHWTWAPERCDLPALLARNTVNGAALVRREAFEAVGGYDASMGHGCEDWDFWLRLVERGFEGAIVPEVLFHYRRRTDSMSRAMAADPVRHPLHTLVAKHRASYGAHVLDVILARHEESLHLAREIDAMERTRLLVLDPSLRRAREERDAAADKAARAVPIATLREERDRLAWQAGELEREVRELHASWSWRITAPLRTAFARLTGRPRR